MCVADAFCPHLGAHLGPKSGGVVREGTGRPPGLPVPRLPVRRGRTLRRHSARPATAEGRLQTYPVQETGGFIFAYWDHQGRPPAWRLPEIDAGYRGRVLTRLRLRTHPQVTTENSVDFGHLLHIHGYYDLEQLAPTVIDGPFLTSRYSFSRYMLTRGLGALRFAMEIQRSTSAGWGYPWSTCTAPLPAYACCSGSWQPRSTATCSTCGWRSIHKGRQRLPWLRLLPAWVSNRLAPRIMLHELVLDVRKDYRIWEHHRYRHDPVFSKGDSDIYRFRRYSRQFYPGPNGAQLCHGYLLRRRCDTLKESGQVPTRIASSVPPAPGPKLAHVAVLWPRPAPRARRPYDTIVATAATLLGSRATREKKRAGAHHISLSDSTPAWFRLL